MTAGAVAACACPQPSVPRGTVLLLCSRDAAGSEELLVGLGCPAWGQESPAVPRVLPTPIPTRWVV